MNARAIIQTNVDTNAKILLPNLVFGIVWGYLFDAKDISISIIGIDAIKSNSRLVFIIYNLNI